MTDASDHTAAQRGVTWLFAAALFLSASLLFSVQPMFAKMVLPLLGGTAAVWNTCMVFYQAVLLGGYVYAHLTVGWLGVRRQAALHLGILCLAWISLPIGIAAGWTPPTTSNPVPWLLLLLTVSLGLPLFVVSASAPMLQAWFAGTGHPAGKDPYFLYAASNLGSLLALLGYPILIEPLLLVTRQSLSWAIGYGVLMALIAACAAVLWLGRGQAVAAPASAGPPPPAKRGKQSARKKHPTKSRAAEARSPGLPWPLRLRWLVLALVPSSLLLGVTAHISTDIAAVPLLWVVPLALYLLTFVFVFARRTILPEAWMLHLQTPLVLLLAVLFFNGLMLALPWLWLFLHLATFFVTAMVCHGELARTRPDPGHLTEFYLWISVGGMLGGMFNAFLAPQVFSLIVEYPLMIAAACLLRPPLGPKSASANLGWRDFAWPAGLLVAGGGLLFALERANYLLSPGFIALVLLAIAVPAFFFRWRPIRLGLCVGAILLIGALDFGGSEYVLYSQRNFFGVLRVREAVTWVRIQQAGASPQAIPVASHVLLHGSTKHGAQWLDELRRDQPTSYFARSGPLGDIFAATAAREGFEQIGITGLGAGSIAAYGEPGWEITFFEIDPAVEQVARDTRFFTYLAHCKADVNVVLGDARLSLQEVPGGQFDLLILDAFASDSVPVHLITRQAAELYLDKLAPGGLLAFQISNRYLNLEPILGRIAAELGLVSRIRIDDREPSERQSDGSESSTWVVMARSQEHLGSLADHREWKPTSTDAPLWTDDFSNIVSVLSWTGSSRQE